MLRWMSGLNLKNRVRNNRRDSLKIAPMEDTLRQSLVPCTKFSQLERVFHPTWTTRPSKKKNVSTSTVFCQVTQYSTKSR